MNAAAALLLLLSPSVAAQAAGDLGEARRLWLRGNYAEAGTLFEKLAARKDLHAQAVVGRSRCLENEGSYDEAEKVVAAGLKAAPDDPRLLARLAEIHYLRGRWDQAAKTASRAIAEDEENFEAHWVLGQVQRDRGELDKADETFRWFVRIYVRRSNEDREIVDPDLLRLIGLAGLERARYHRLADQFPFILNEVYAFAAKQEKEFWIAEYEKGRLFHEKHNRAAAFRAYDRALTLNPRAAEVLVGKGKLAAQRFEFKDAEGFADRALAVNPHLTSALRLKADVLYFAGDYEGALKILEKARAVNPREETTLGRIAACFHLLHRHKDFDGLLAEVRRHDDKPAVFHYELAEKFEDRKFYHLAEKHFLQAIDLRPKMAEPLAGLGLLKMRLADEAGAKKILDQAFDADEYNVRVSNTLKVLRHLDDYATLRTKHFLVRYDPANDQVLAAFLGKYLEDIYEELAARFDYRPQGPILIEVFNKHEMFSGRVVNLPDLHTIGACTGKMVAMVSPRDKSGVIAKPFNWNRVMRHELVHIFNLEQTEFRVPHWLTEGLAVALEGSGTPPRWNTLLADKMQAGELLDLNTILLGFVRPRSPDEWHLAYMQSRLYVEYLETTHGAKAIGKLLAAFAEGLETDAALKKAAGVSRMDFEKGYRAFLDTKVPKNLTKGEKALPNTLRDLREAQAKKPDDPDLTAALAERYYRLGNKAEARKLADQALETKKFHPVAVYVKARLLGDGGDADIAFDLLRKAAEEGCDDIRPLRLLAKMHLDRKDAAAAAPILERCRKEDPHDPFWLGQLARVYDEVKDVRKLLAVLEDIARADPDDLGVRRKLAQLHAGAGNHAQAETFARRALEIDVLDDQAQTLLLEALAAQNKNEEADRYRKLLGK